MPDQKNPFKLEAQLVPQQPPSLAQQMQATMLAQQQKQNEARERIRYALEAMQLRQKGKSSGASQEENDYGLAKDRFEMRRQEMFAGYNPRELRKLYEKHGQGKLYKELQRLSVEELANEKFKREEIYNAMMEKQMMDQGRQEQMQLMASKLAQAIGYKK